MNQIRPFLLCLMCSFVTVVAVAQVHTVTIVAQNEPLAKVMKQIEKQSGYTFFYSDKTVDTSRLVTINAVDKDVLAVVKELFGQENLQYSLLEGNIVISEADKSKSPDKTPKTDHRFSANVPIKIVRPQ